MFSVRFKETNILKHSFFGPHIGIQWLQQVKL